jgi:hypothetical protein
MSDRNVTAPEFKLDGSAATALAQIKTHQYATKYLDKAKPVHLVGVNFDAETGTVQEWLEEIVSR